MTRLTGLLLLAVCSCSPTAKTTTNESSGSTHLFVWAWDIDTRSDDFLTVVDVDRQSATYGQVVGTVPAPGGRGAHHVEYELSTIMGSESLIDHGGRGKDTWTLPP